MVDLLYVKSNYSLLKSLLSIDDIINYNLSNKKEYAAFCDDNLYGVMEFIKKCQASKLKPVVGLEVVVDDLKILLYIKNYEGYLNLIKICTLQNDKSLTIDKLIEYKDNLIFIVPFLSKDFYLKYKEKFASIYLGFDSKMEEKMALEITHDVVFLRLCLYKVKEESEYLKYLYMISLGKTINDEISYDVDNHEMVISSDLKLNSYSLKNVREIISSCNLVMASNPLLLPLYECPSNVSASKYLMTLANYGLYKRLNNMVPSNYQNRLDYELKVIDEMGFSNYFLVVFDFIRDAKKKGILVGPGRGSAAGSLVAYSLGITEIDSLKYNLLFERFLNPERKTMPDIDTDIPDVYRDEMIKYVISKYGEKRVAGIVTFSTLSSRQVIRDVFKVMVIPVYKTEKLSALIPVNYHGTLNDLFKENSNFREYILGDDSLKKAFKVALKLEGLKRQIGTHAAGIVMCQKNLDEVIPLTKNDEMYLTGYSMAYLEELGLLKMDFLGIRNLTIIMNILKMIRDNRKINIDFNKIELDDGVTYDLFKEGRTLGVFQFESSGMRKFLKRLKPSNFNDLVAAIALFRPGPSENIDTYIARKEKKETVRYPFPVLESILKETYGIMIYQEQIMQVAAIYAGYSLGEADILRRAISKKKVDILKQEEANFLARSLKLGRPVEVTKSIFADILKFAGYGFNKSHAVAYSMVAYKMAYLKANYKLEFYTNLLNNVIGVEGKMFEYLREIREYHIEVIKCDILRSKDTFTIYDDKIVFPFASIKGVGMTFSKLIVKALVSCEMTSDIYAVFSSLVRGDITKKQIETLIMADCFRNFPYSKKTLMNNLDSLYNYGELTKDLDESLVLRPVLEKFDEYSSDLLLEQEKNCYGFYVSNHPVTSYKNKYNNIISLSDIGNYLNRTVRVLVMVDGVRKIKTKKGEDMAFVSASDESMIREFVLFPKVFKNNPLIKGDICVFTGSVERRYDEVQMIVNKIEMVRSNHEFKEDNI